MPDPKKLLADLNLRQKEAVLATRGPVLIVAGAGSGKTSALTRRIAYLIAAENVPPHQILAVTFTNKAAKEMQERLQKLLTPEDAAPPATATFPGQFAASRPTVGTFHSICVQILRREIHHLGRERDFTIYDDTDQRALMRQIFDDLKIDEKEVAPRAVLGAISRAKSEMVGPDAFGGDSPFAKKVAEIYPVYQKRLRENNALDFDDILNETVVLFQQYPLVLEKYQEKWHYICVDEYQDTNRPQDLFTNLLAEKYRNVCVIGDPDQSIYSWRGADLRNILQFKKRYQEAREIKLEQNYRSTQNILDAANAVIGRNKNREEKKLWTKGERGEKILLITASDERMEAELIAREVLNRVRDERARYADCAVLYRTNAQSRVLEEAFLRHGLPHRIVGGVKFYARKEVKDVLGYLRLLQNPADDLALLRVINVPARKIGPKTLQILTEYAVAHGLPLSEALRHAPALAVPASKQETLLKFAAGMESLRALNRTEKAAGMIAQIVARTKLRDFWNSDGKAEGEARYENVRELQSVATKYDTLEAGVSLATFLEEVALLSDLDKTAEGAPDAVTLMTLHAAKGLEFPLVFIVGLEQNIFPNARTLLEPWQLEEERRLFYVGITRAMRELFLLHARQRLLFGETQLNAPSEFLKDLPREVLATEDRAELFRRGYGHAPVPLEIEGEEAEKPFDALPEFAVGDRVSHPTFGVGVIAGLVGGVVEVEFVSPAYGRKKLALSIAPLSKLAAKDGSGDV